tara:strand:+ start:36 stop:455 length:420 start_codon:yes stop_codon:yes gene_type:complete
MKNLLNLLILFLLPIFLFGQESYHNNQTICGKKKGKTPTFDIDEWSEEYILGLQQEPTIIQSFCVYKRHKDTNEKVTGIVYEEYPNGNLKYEIFYKNGRVKGWGNYYNSDGSLYCQYKYKSQWIFGHVLKRRLNAKVKY